MHFKSRLKALGLGITFVAALSGCSSDGDHEGIILPPSGDPTNSSGQSNNGTLIPEELADNYEILDIMYFYAHLNNELSEDIMDYFEAPLQESYGASICTKDYSDVCYMYSKMSDPFTRYYDPNYAPLVLSMLEQSDKQYGVGLEIDSLAIDGQNVMVIDQVYPKSPAEKAGVEQNDTLLTIDNTAPGSLKAANALLSGEKGDSVTVEVKRGSDTLAIKMEINEFITPTVFVSSKESIPVIRITEFTNETVSDSGTYGEFVTALKKTEGAKSTIIDLRGNPGGDTRQCNSISAELLNEGDIIIIDIETNVDSVISNHQKRYIQVFDTVTYSATQDGIGKDRYYVFLADSTSASCAEVMLSAVTVNKKSPIVGLTSYGKGIGQYLVPTRMEGLALVTGLRSMDKNGDVYHQVGIVPDFESGDAEEQMEKAIEWAKEMKQTRRTEGYYGKESTGHFAMKARAKDSKVSLPKNRREFLQQLGGKITIKK